MAKNLLLLISNRMSQRNVAPMVRLFRELNLNLLNRQE